MSDYFTSEQSALFSPNMRLGVFWRLDTDPVAHLWTGVHDVRAGITAMDPDGTTYIGAGRLMSIPDLEQLVNGVADRVEFYLSATQADIFGPLLGSLISGDVAIKGKRCVVGIAPMDERYQIVSPIIPIWTGIADFWQAEQKPNNDPSKPSIRTILVSVGSGSTNRSRNKVLAWTDAEHRLTHPDDGFFSRVSRYTQQYTVTWPRF